MKPNEIDCMIGKNIRSCRLAHKWTQEELGAKINVSAQQVQKFETGLNRVSAQQLFILSQSFGVSLYAFFRASKESDSAESSAEGTDGTTFQQSDR